MLDGLDGDRVRQRRALAPNLNALLDGRGGARSTLYEESRSVMFAETNPNHVAMASGAYGGQSGIPGNAFAVYGKTRDEDSCPTGSLDESKPPTETSGESPDCLEADTFFEAVAKGPRAKEITTAGVFGKPKLGRIFAGRSASGRFFADHLFAPCEKAGRGDDPSYCENVLVGPTGASAKTAFVMNEVIETTREGVRADGTRKRPNLRQLPADRRLGSWQRRRPRLRRRDQQRRYRDRALRPEPEATRLWKRTTMIVLSDHSMDTPQKTSLTQCYRAAGIDSDDL